MFFIIPTAYSQTDTSGLVITADTTINQKVMTDTLNVHSPKKATIMSAILPGLGQVYNKKYWKIPVIYAGFVGLGYFIGINHFEYVKYRDAYIKRVDGDSTTIDPLPDTQRLSTADLLAENDYYRKKRDMLIIGAVGLYVLNIIDATVDAHLFTFDVSDDLSFNIRPVIYSSFQTKETYAGLTLRIKL